MDKAKKLFWYWILERELIRIKKEEGKPWPWTHDPILQKYRFCNVFREHDTVTRWIKANWRDPYQDHPNLPFAMAMARQINWPDTLAEIGFPEEWDAKRVHDIMQSRKDRGDKVYTGAYMLTGTLGGTKVEQTVYKILDPLYHNPPEILPESLERTWAEYLPRPGFSGFMAYEVVSDLRHTPVLQDAEDINTWAHAGPGAVRGLNRYFGRDYKMSMNKKEALVEMRFLLGLSRQCLPNWFPTMELRDIEHSLCEYDKYMRTYLGEGRPRSLYRRA